MSDGRAFTFEDAGAHGANNPTELALGEFDRIISAEARRESNPTEFAPQERIGDGGYNHYLTSIGTGAKGLALQHPQKKRGKVRRTVNNIFDMHRRAHELARGFARYATDTSAVEERMEKRSKLVPRRYVRSKSCDGT